MSLHDLTCPLCGGRLSRKIASIGRKTKLTKRLYCESCNYRTIEVKERRKKDE